MSIFDIWMAVLFIPLLLLVHEMAHYFAARYYKLEAEFKLSGSKKIKSIWLRILNMGLPFPSVYIKNIENYDQLNVTCLAPIPFCFVITTSYLMLSTFNPGGNGIYWFPNCIVWGLFFTLLMSTGDLQIINEWYRIKRNIRVWYEKNI